MPGYLFHRSQYPFAYSMLPQLIDQPVAFDFKLHTDSLFLITTLSPFAFENRFGSLIPESAYIRFIYFALTATPFLLLNPPSLIFIRTIFSCRLFTSTLSPITNSLSPCTRIDTDSVV